MYKYFVILVVAFAAFVAAASAYPRAFPVEAAPAKESLKGAEQFYYGGYGLYGAYPAAYAYYG